VAPSVSPGNAMTKHKVNKHSHQNQRVISPGYPLRRTLSSADAVVKSGKLLKRITRKFFLGCKITLEPFRAIVKAQRTRWVYEGAALTSHSSSIGNIGLLSDNYRF
jgi:hypothetical protein